MSKREHRVLCVEDHVDASSLLDRHLRADVECTLVANAEAALTQMDEGGPYAVVVTDYVLPGMDGVQLMRAIKHRWPETVGVMVTGSEDFNVVVTALNDGNVYRFVRKPWQPEDLRQAVREALSYHQLFINERSLREQLARTNAELDEKVQDLDEANELLEYWVEFSPAVLFSMSVEDGTLRPSYISKNFHRLTGFERTAAVIDANFWLDLLHVEDRPRYREALASLLGSDSSIAVLEYRVRRRDGSYVRIVDSMRAVRDGDGETVELVGAWMDVTARQH